MDYLKTGLSGVQTDTTSVAAANGMLPPFSVQNLLTMAALGQPQLGASNQQISAQLTNAAPASMCKYFNLFFFLLFLIYLNNLWYICLMLTVVFPQKLLTFSSYTELFILLRYFITRIIKTLFLTKNVFV